MKGIKMWNFIQKNSFKVVITIAIILCASMMIIGCRKGNPSKPPSSIPSSQSVTTGDTQANAILSTQTKAEPLALWSDNTMPEIPDIAPCTGDACPVDPYYPIPEPKTVAGQPKATPTGMVITIHFSDGSEQVLHVGRLKAERK